MLKKNNTGLTIGLVAFIFLASFVYLLSKGNITPIEQAVAETAKASKEKEAAPAAVPPAAAPDSNKSLLAAPTSMAIDVPALMKDRVLGNENAPVTIIEYASMTCPHCALFATKVLPEVKKLLLDTGKAKLIFRDYPLDKSALKAAMMARCISPDKYYQMVEVIFSNQAHWAAAKEPLEALAQLASLAGMDNDSFKSCTENTELETAILNGVQDAQNKYHITSTPSFIFNNGVETLSGAQDPQKFEAIVNKLTKGK